MENEIEKESSDLDWENRTLCSDGNCIGVIGPDGRCKECGKPYDAAVEDLIEDPERKESAPQEEESTEPLTEETTDAPTENDQPQRSAPDADQDEEPDADWESRTLCSDGSCIGVIGPDGRCKECGKPLEE